MKHMAGFVLALANGEDDEGKKSHKAVELGNLERERVFWREETEIVQTYKDI